MERLACPACGSSIDLAALSAANPAYVCPACGHQGTLAAVAVTGEQTVVNNVAHTTVEIPIHVAQQANARRDDSTAVTGGPAALIGGEKTTVIAHGASSQRLPAAAGSQQQPEQDSASKTIVATSSKLLVAEPSQGDDKQTNPTGASLGGHTVILSPGLLHQPQPQEWSGAHQADSKVWQTRATQRFTLVAQQAEQLWQQLLGLWSRIPPQQRKLVSLLAVLLLVALLAMGRLLRSTSSYQYIQVDTALLHQVVATEQQTSAAHIPYVMLPAGATVNVLERQGNYVVIQDLQGQVGYVPKHAINSVAPKRNPRAAFVDCVRGFQETDLQPCLGRAERQWDSCKATCNDSAGGCNTTCRARYGECEANCRERIRQPEPEPMQPSLESDNGANKFEAWRDKPLKRK